MSEDRYETCAVCKFAFCEETSPGSGKVLRRECREGSPVRGDGFGLARWPTVSAADWCGRWEESAEAATERFFRERREEWAQRSREREREEAEQDARARAFVAGAAAETAEHRAGKLQADAALALAEMRERPTISGPGVWRTMACLATGRRIGDGG